MAKKARKLAVAQQRRKYNTPSMRALVAELVARRTHTHQIVEAIQATLEVPAAERGEHNTKTVSLSVVQEIIRDARADLIRESVIEESGDARGKKSRAEALAESVAFYESVIRHKDSTFGEKMRARKALDDLYGLVGKRDGDDDRQAGQEFIDFIEQIRGGVMDPPSA